MVTHTHFLRRVLAIDSIGTGAMALIAVIAAQPLSVLLGIPIQWLTIVGLLLLSFAAWVGWLARQENPPHKLVWLLIAGNAVWIADCVVLMFSDWLPLTALGIEFMAAQVLLTAVITAREYVALRRASGYTRLPV